MILFFGSAGAGKSVQGKRLADRYGINWVSSGEVLRRSSNQHVWDHINRGQLADDATMYEVMHQEFDANRGKQWILDGFPRTVSQADWLIEHQDEYQYNIDVVVLIEIPKEEAINRLLNRGRTDDTEESIEKRLQIFSEQVMPIIDHLAQNNVPVVRIGGVGDEGTVHNIINDEVKKYITNNATN